MVSYLASHEQEEEATSTKPAPEGTEIPLCTINSTYYNQDNPNPIHERSIHHSQSEIWSTIRQSLPSTEWDVSAPTNQATTAGLLPQVCFQTMSLNSNIFFVNYISVNWKNRIKKLWAWWKAILDVYSVDEQYWPLTGWKIAVCPCRPDHGTLHPIACLILLLYLGHTGDGG